ncbi:MAG: hypothetical protein HYV97_19970 [Bdellovibrio sp.]|nr:hypothetical protein [Bdellovibrio sp.]
MEVLFLERPSDFSRPFSHSSQLPDSQGIRPHFHGMHMREESNPNSLQKALPLLRLTRMCRFNQGRYYYNKLFDPKANENERIDCPPADSAIFSVTPPVSSGEWPSTCPIKIISVF